MAVAVYVQQLEERDLGVGKDAGRQHAGSGGASVDKFRGNVKRGLPGLKLGQWQVVREPTKRKEA